MSNTIISGKTIKEWTEYFHISVSEDMSIGECRHVGTRIIGLYQEATRYKVIAESRSAILENSRKTEAAKKFAGIYNSFKGSDKRMPAKDTIVALTDAELASFDEAIALLYAETNFWKGILHMLDTTRKLIETITMSHGIEAKALNYQNFSKE